MPEVDRTSRRTCEAPEACEPAREARRNQVGSGRESLSMTAPFDKPDDR
jgi:hypothetical protein